MKSYTDRHWAVEEKREMHDVSLLTRVHLSLFLYGESQWRNRPSGLWVHGSMPICISSSTQGESQWRNRPKVYEYRGSMPICIVCQPLQYSLLLIQQLANPYHYIKKHRQYYHWPCTCSPGISKISNSKVCKKCKNQCKQSTKYKWNYCQYSKDSF